MGSCAMLGPPLAYPVGGANPETATTFSMTAKFALQEMMSGLGVARLTSAAGRRCHFGAAAGFSPALSHAPKGSTRRIRRCTDPTS
jgi:hypothetical protein